MKCLLDYGAEFGVISETYIQVLKSSVYLYASNFDLTALTKISVNARRAYLKT